MMIRRFLQLLKLFTDLEVMVGTEIQLPERVSLTELPVGHLDYPNPKVIVP